MATIIPQGGIVEIATVCRLGSQNGINRRHWRLKGPTLPTLTVEDFVQVFGEQLGIRLKAVLVSGASYRGAIARLIRPFQSVSYTSTLSQGPGLNAGDALPPQTAGLISLKSDSPGRRGRGRMYLPFPSEASSGADGKPMQAYVNAASQLVMLLTQSRIITIGGVDNEVEPVIFSRVDGQSARITAMTVRQSWATQRRRSEINRGDMEMFS